MSDQPKTLKEIHATLKTLRENSSSRKRFPQQIWDAIIELTEVLPFQEVCQQLEIQPAYLKRKMQQSQNIPPDTINFQEVSYNTHSLNLSDAIVIELISHSGLRAKIQGPSSCLNFLSSLFGGK